MKATRVHEFGEPEVLQFEEIPDPVPEDNQVLVAVHAVGVNPVETYVRAGIHARRPALPYTPGADAAGVIEAVGRGVSTFAVGDRVYTAGTLSGTYAEKCLCADSQVYPLPEGISFAEGAALGIPYGTAYRALFHRAKAQPGETVLIHGASGGVGIAAMQFALAAGIRVIGTAGNDAGMELLAKQGAHEIFNHHESNHLARILEATGGQGVNIILEMLADVNLGDDLGALARFGRVVIIGSRSSVEITPRELMMRDADVLGMTMMNLSREDRDSIHAAIHAGLKNGSLHPVVSKEMPLADAVQAHHDVIESSTHGKIVLVP